MSKSKKSLALRPYQTEAVKNLHEAHVGGQRALLCLPTGSGKTFTAIRFLKDVWEKNWKASRGDLLFYWTAHLGELLVQAEETIRSVFGEDHPIAYWNAKSKPDVNELDNGTFVLTQIQSTRTFKRGIRRSVLVVDETHREAAKSYRTFEDELQPEWKMGLTATPYRLDKKELGYDTIAYQTTLLELASQGWLATPKYVKVSTGRNYELHIQGDYTKKALEELGADLCRADMIVEHYVKNKGLYGKSIMFCPSVKAAVEIAEKLRLKGVRAEHLSGLSTPIIREAVVHDFKANKLDVLCNVQLFTEGFDCPDVKSVLLARPTLSKSLWLQAVGRGARVAPPLIAPAQDHFFVVDFVDNVKMYPLTAEDFSVELLNAPESARQKQIKEEDEWESKLKKKARTKEEMELIVQMRKKGRILDMIGYMKVTNLYTSEKKGTRIWQSYPIFKQELPYFKCMYQRLFDMMGTKKAYPFIHSSFERGGNQTNLTKKSWLDLSWAIFHHLRALHEGVRHKWPVLETIYRFPVPKDKVDLTLIANDEPMASEEGNIKAVIAAASTRFGKIGYVSLSYTTVFVTVSNPMGYFWKGTISQLEEQLSKQYQRAVSVKKVMGTNQ